MARDLPEIVRIKRKRNQDSLQALILEAPRNKRIKDEAYVFKLRRTDLEIIQLPTDGEAVLPLLQESSHKTDKHNTYVIPKERKTEDLPEQFNDMLESFLTVQEGESKPLKRRKQKGIAVITTDAVDLEYVYDVYYRDKAVADSWENDKVGYIKFEEDYDDALGDGDSEKYVSDDEDSNAEDFYKNDYPEDEDDHTTDEAGSEEEFEKLTESLHKEAAAQSPKAQDVFEELYEEYYGSTSHTTDFLACLNESDDGDQDMDYEEVEHPRQKFFPDEEDDELAMHRDKIFGKLQKMIDEDY